MRLEPSTQRGQRRREELLAAAQAVFERAGYFDTRVADIVELAHASQGTFYTYFDSKDDVLRSLVDRMVEDLYAASEVPTLDEREPFAHLEASIRQFMIAYKANAKMMRILDQVVTFSDDFRATRLEIMQRFNARIEGAIRALQARGEGDPDLDARHAAHVLGGMVSECAFALYVLRQDLDEAVAISTMARIWATSVGIPVGQPESQRARRLRA